MVNPEIIAYIEQEILPCYDHFDAAHQRDHIDAVISRSLELAKHYDVDSDMVYTIAAYHDTGICEGRETHHLVSGCIIREDQKLRDWFTEEQIETMAQAAEDHRASSGSEPRSIYGKIVAEADRLISPEKVIRRTIQFTQDHFPDYDKEQQYQRFREAPIGEILRHRLSPPLDSRVGQRGAIGRIKENHSRRKQDERSF